MKKDKKDQQDQELQDKQLEDASGGNQLWGDWFIVQDEVAVQDGVAAPDAGSLATKEGADERSEDKR